MNPDWGSLWAWHHLHIKPKKRFIGHTGSMTSPVLATILCRRGSHKHASLLWVSGFRLLLQIYCDIPTPGWAVEGAAVWGVLHAGGVECAPGVSKQVWPRRDEPLLRFNGDQELTQRASRDLIFWIILLWWYGLLRSWDRAVLFQKLS